MPFEFGPDELNREYFEEFSTPKQPQSCQVNDVSDCKNCNLQGCRGCRGENIVCKDIRKSYKRDIGKKAFSPLSPLTPNEQRFFDLTGHVPGDAWEGELPDDGLPFDGVQLCRSIPWPEVMAAADQERQWGRKSTLALMWPHHEGRFEWYEHPITKKWHSYAAFPN